LDYRKPFFIIYDDIIPADFFGIMIEKPAGYSIAVEDYQGIFQKNR
jgi:hypothetical protein